MPKIAPHLRVYLFGAPRIEQDGISLSFGRQKGLALLAVLCTEPYPHSRDKLLDLLWPLFTDEDGRNNLRRELSLLKATLGPELITADRNTISLEAAELVAGSLEVDVHSFERLLTEVREHGEGDELICPDCAGKLSTAAAIYNDHFLAGFSLPDSPAFDEWQFFQTERCRQAAATVFRRLATWHEGLAEYETALEYGRRRLALDPLHESVHRALMRLYEIAGQHSAALRQYETLTQLLHRELGIAPDQETESLYEAIKARRIAEPPGVVERPATTTVTRPRTRHNLPAETTQFVGREREVDALDALLSEPGVRLITLLGVGGIGKTRLALAAATNQIDRQNGSSLRFPDGVFWVNLAPLDHSSQIVAAIARAVDFAFHGERDQARQLNEYLRERRLLLLLDNYEHLVDAEGVRLLVDLLGFASGVSAIVTSRTRLGARGEHLFSLSGLRIPESPPDLSGEDNLANLGAANGALALFCQAARRVKPDFSLDRSNLPMVMQICRLVEGMPLGIELAAGWLEMLSVDEITAEIEKSLDFLEADWPDLPERQSSLRAVFNSSWRLLTPQEQSVLMALTIFRGGFSRQAAEEVAGASLKTLLSLRMKSWLQPTETERYQIHELLRQYAALELRNVPEGDERIHKAHAAYYGRYLMSMEPLMRGPKPGTAYAAIEHDLDNVQAAVDWLVSHDDIRRFVTEILPALFRYLESHYRYFIFQSQIDRAEDRAAALGLERELGILLIVKSAFFFNGYPTRYMDYHWVSAVSIEVINRAWKTMPAEPVDTGFWSTLLGWQYGRFVVFDFGVDRLRRLLAQFRVDGRRWEAAFASQCLGRLLTPRPWDAVQHNPTGEARALLEDALVAFRELGDEREEAVTLLFLGFERQSMGDMKNARDLALKAQKRLLEMGDEVIAVTINWNLAEIHLELGELEESLRMFHELAQAYIRAGRPHLAIDGLSRESYEAVRYGDLDYAQKLRERCLELSRAAGHLGYESWDSWEMGELYRVKGDYAQAREWYDRSLILFQAITTAYYQENEVGQSFYHRGIGDLALVAGDHVEARSHFEQAAHFAEATQHTWQYAYVVTGLGKAAVQAKDPETARRHLADALEIGFKTGDAGIVLVTFAAAVRLFSMTHQIERARYLAERIFAHPLSWNETRREVSSILELDLGKENRRKQSSPFDLSDDVELLLAELRKP